MNLFACAATMQGVWISYDGGEAWNRPLTPIGGMYNEARCWSIASHADRPCEFLAGTDQGLYKFNFGAKRFDYVASPMDDLHILQIAIDPKDPDFIVCGTRPGELFISSDGGRSWERSNLRAATECWFINTTRITSIHFDPVMPDTIWTTIEIDGVFRSDDRGKNWIRLIDGLQDCDTHDLVFYDKENGSRTIFCSTEDGLHFSEDNAQTWVQAEVPQAPWPYWRSIKERANDCSVIFASIGDKPSGEAGALLRSDDCGQKWRQVELPVEPNSTIWSIATHPSDPNILFFATIFGQIFRSLDGGLSWHKMLRELGEIRMIAWSPLAS